MDGHIWTLDEQHATAGNGAISRENSHTNPDNPHIPLLFCSIFSALVFFSIEKKVAF
jgi:hypothetical protein